LGHFWGLFRGHFEAAQFIEKISFDSPTKIFKKALALTS
jgi:hypothetical protein